MPKIREGQYFPKILIHRRKGATTDGGHAVVVLEKVLILVRLHGLFSSPGDPERPQYAKCKQIEAPSDFDSANADALAQGDIERDQEYVGHRKFSQYMHHRQDCGFEQVKMDQRKGDGFGVGGKERKYRYDQSEKDIRGPEGLNAC